MEAADRRSSRCSAVAEGIREAVDTLKYRLCKYEGELALRVGDMARGLTWPEGEGEIGLFRLAVEGRL